jgi:hypothetical protein
MLPAARSEPRERELLASLSSVIIATIADASTDIYSFPLSAPTE